MPKVRRENYEGRKVVRRKRSPFAVWAEDKKVGPDHVVKHLRCSRSYAYSLLNGSATPGTKMRLAIAKWTEGAVSFDCWGA